MIKAKFWYNNWIIFNLIPGRYENLITFLDAHQILFLSEIELEIPIFLHGKGISKTLLDYLSNNEGDNNLILQFLNYFMNMFDFRYSTGRKLNFTFDNSINNNWQNLNLIIYPNIVTTTTTTPLPVIIEKGPYLIYGDEMQVLWQNDVSSIDTIKWSTDNLIFNSDISTEYNNDHQHKYIISGLTSGTKYYYQIIAGNSTENGTFYTPANTTSLKFFAYGDSRTGINYHDEIANRIISTYELDSDYQTLIISMGDLVLNGSNEYYWSSEFFNKNYSGITNMLKNLPYQSAVGNHDLGVSELFTKYFPYSFVNNRYYSYDYGPVHFIVIDQYTSFNSGSTQYNWIVDELSNTNKQWIIPYFHIPGWSAGTHPNNPIVQNDLEPLFEQYGVHITFAGHNHYYSRAVINSGLTTEVTHITTGGGGAPLYSVDLQYPNVVSASSNYHYCKIEILDNVLNFEAISNTGILLDSFTINL